ncbi:uncharacterized protein DUF4389 [Chitinophaga niastensis]|uniref:Uncharacterized protein DUF4389 n=1 Tax=Chitinophaga niastensis TaxID=536980 RepID=A0A2P8HEX6_CHINA|nr:DUF4389 domain-containing protein [Chitinophaga niastensis]PSL44751.1 uncharacterized protein DUF4389 [Chitinophaga niastensis]
MKLEIKHQQRYSRGELLLRSFLGFFYIMIPHGFCLAFVGIWAFILWIITFIKILVTGQYPKSNFDFFIKFFRWNLRVNARALNLSDGYPAFGLDAADDNTTFEMPYTENVSRGHAALVFFLGCFLLIPQIFCLYFVAIGAMFVMLFAWFAVLFTGEYPAGMHDYMVKYLRWSMRLSTYLHFMIQSYPPFNGRPDEGDEQDTIDKIGLTAA